MSDLELTRRAREVAEQAALQAGVLLMKAYRNVEAREKGPADLVTDADTASQRLIAEILFNAFPDHTLLAEEDGVLPDPNNPWRWVVDPLDGTVNFAHGVPLWCVSIGLEHRGQPVVGVVNAPTANLLYSAALGQGATENGRPATVSTTRHLAESLLVTGMPTNFADDAARQLALFGRFSTGTHSVRRTGCSAWNLALVASGGYEACYATAMNPWDAAAGVALIREAGGVVTDLHGGPFDLYTSSILASNGRVHDEAVAAARLACESAERSPGYR